MIDQDQFGTKPCQVRLDTQRIHGSYCGKAYSWSHRPSVGQFFSFGYLMSIAQLNFVTHENIILRKFISAHLIFPGYPGYLNEDFRPVIKAPQLL